MNEAQICIKLFVFPFKTTMTTTSPAENCRFPVIKTRAGVGKRLLVAALYAECGAALGLAHGELHHSAHVPAGLFQGEPVHRAAALQADPGPRRQSLTVQGPHWWPADSHRHLTLESGPLWLGHLHVLQLLDHHQGLTWGTKIRGDDDEVGLVVLLYTCTLPTNLPFLLILLFLSFFSLCVYIYKEKKVYKSQFD